MQWLLEPAASPVLAMVSTFHLSFLLLRYYRSSASFRVSGLAPSVAFAAAPWALATPAWLVTGLVAHLTWLVACERLVPGSVSTARPQAVTQRPTASAPRPAAAPRAAAARPSAPPAARPVAPRQAARPAPRMAAAISGSSDAGSTRSPRQPTSPRDETARRAGAAGSRPAGNAARKHQKVRFPLLASGISDPILAPERRPKAPPEHVPATDRASAPRP